MLKLIHHASHRRLLGKGLGYGLTMLLLVAWGSTGCVVGDVGFATPGCEVCPERCLQNEEGRGRCVACLKDEQCQSKVSPTKRCTQDNKCICGSDKDCPEGRYCIGEGGCVECRDDKDCKGEAKKACVGYQCTECRRGEFQSCGPNNQNVCKKGTQTCLGSGAWGDCKDWVVCKSGETCENETCVSACPATPPCKAGERRCDPDSSGKNEFQRCVRNAKGCLEWSKAEACTPGFLCMDDGQCKPEPCPSGKTSCGQACVDLQADTKHCGACNNACPSGEVCNSGKCEGTCKAPKTDCNGSCVDTQTNTSHCGGCGKACKPSESCTAGQCKSKCPSGEVSCNGVCVDTSKDSKNCGQCGNSCPSGQSCQNSRCTTICTAGLSLCNGKCVDTRSDVSNCGTCGTTCKSGEACVSGACKVSCPSGQTSCNGACKDLQNDKQNCGGCGKACSSQQACSQGKCQSPCPTGQMMCSGVCTDVQNNDYHCGGCNKKCPTKQSCTKGVCKSCVGSTTTEVCGNNKDDDCDGQIDELSECGSIPVKNGIADYAVRDNGDILVVHSSTSSGIQATCYKPGGSSLRSLFTVEPKSSFSQSFPSVQTAPGSSTYVVAWIQASSSSSSTRNLYLQRFDSKCQAVGSKITWPYTNANGSYTYSVAMDGSGNFAALFRDTQRNLRLVFFNSSGKKLSDLPVETGTKQNCPGSGYGVQLTMNKSGAGVVSCQRHSSNPIYYRRFSAQRTFIDSAMIQLKGSVSNSSWYESHATGINDKGEFAIEWQAYNKGANWATFFSSTGAAVKSDVSVSPYIGYGYDGFRYVHQQLQILGGDFILRDTVRSSRDVPTWYRYNSKGTLVSALRAAYQPWLLRTNGKAAYAVDGSTIKMVDLSPGKGICKGMACVCKPGTKQVCYNGGTSTSVRGACKTGTQVCQPDGLGWSSCVGEVLPTPEVCNNNKDDDCDGSVDENCTNPQGIDTPGVSDIAVSSKGDLAAVHWNGKALVGYCFHPNSTVKKGTFIIANQSKTISKPFVKMSRNGKYIVVMWRGTPLLSSRTYNVFARLYKSDCTPITGILALTQAQGSEWFDAAVDNSGRFSLLYYNDKRELFWTRYNSAGTVLTKPTMLEKGQLCDYAARISVSSTTGDGVYSCQRHASNPVYFQRFKASGALVGSSLTQVKNTSGNSSWYFSHILGMNDSGEFVIEWQSNKSKTFYANFYSASGALVSSATIGTTMSSTYDAFRFAHPGVKVFGSDFILRDGGRRGTPVTWYRYSSKGVIRSKAAMSVSSYRRDTLRADSNKTYIIDGKFVRVGTVIFK